MARQARRSRFLDYYIRIFAVLLSNLGIVGATCALSLFCVGYSVLVGLAAARALGVPFTGYALTIRIFAPLGLAIPITYGIFQLVLQVERDREELARTTQLLGGSLSRVRELSGLLSICQSCKKVRDDQGQWSEIEAYIGGHSRAEVRHVICPDCVRKGHG